MTRLSFRELGRRIEGDPVLQYKIHKVMSRVWLIITLPLLALAIFAPHVWVVVGIAYVMVASNYANWATDNGAMAAANASTDEDITPFAIEEAEEAGKHELSRRDGRAAGGPGAGQAPAPAEGQEAAEGRARGRRPA